MKQLFTWKQFLIQIFSAVLRFTCARNFSGFILNVELVIVGKLFASINSSLSEDNDAIFSVDLDDFGYTIGVAAVIDVARETARECCINHAVFIKSEHVDSTILSLILFLSQL